MNTIWAIPANNRPDPFRSRGRGLVLLVIVGVGILLTTALSGLTTAASDFGTAPALGLLIRVGAALLAIALNTLLFTFAFRVLTARHPPIHQLRLGAITAAVGWQILQVAGTYYVGHELAGASATYGLFGIVLGLLAWIYLGATLVVFCAEINVVRARKLWPRSLLTPFTDDVALTDADRRTYTAIAVSTRQKGFQTIEVEFDQPEDGDAEEDPAGATGTAERTEPQR